MIILAFFLFPELGSIARHATKTLKTKLSSKSANVKIVSSLFVTLIYKLYTKLLFSLFFNENDARFVYLIVYLVSNKTEFNSSSTIMIIFCDILSGTLLTSLAVSVTTTHY